MIRKIFVFLIFFVSLTSKADSVVTLDVAVTSSRVEVRSGQGNGLSVSYNETGRYLEMKDDYPDFSNYTLQVNANKEVVGRLSRNGSVFTVRLTGQKYKRTIALAGKMIRTKVNLSNLSTATWNYGTQSVNCVSRHPSTNHSVNYNEIVSDTLLSINSIYDCKAEAAQKTYPNSTRITNGQREFILDIREFIARATLPPDIYTGSVIYQNDGWVAQNNAYAVRPKLTLNVSIEKKPFFSGLQFNDSVLNFLVKNHNESAGVRVSGQASTSFNLLGVFSEQDRIKIEARSNNNFRLVAAGGAAIPYSVKLTYRGASSQLVIDGNKQNPTIINPWIITQQTVSSSVSGLLSFDFSTPASQVHNGKFSDNFTLMAELVL